MKSINRFNFLEKIQFYITILERFDYEEKNHFQLIAQFEKLYFNVSNEYDITINMSELFKPIIMLILAPYLSSPYKVAAFQSIRFFFNKTFKDDIITDSNFIIADVIDAIIRFQFIQSEVSADKVVYFELINSLEFILFNDIEISIPTESILQIINKLFSLLLENNIGRDELAITSERLLITIYQKAFDYQFTSNTAISLLDYVLNKLEDILDNINDANYRDNDDLNVVTSISLAIPNSNPKVNEIILYIRILKSLILSDNVFELYHSELNNERIQMIIILLSLVRGINTNILEEILNVFICICHSNILQISIIIEYMLKYVYIKCFTDISQSFTQNSKYKASFSLKEFEVIINSLHKLLSLISFLPSLYLSFDCNPIKINLCANLIDSILSAYRLAVTNSSVLSNIVINCYHQLCNRLYNKHVNQNITIDNQIYYINEMKNMKAIIIESSKKFSEKPRSCFIYLQEKNIISAEINVSTVVKYIRENSFLSKTSVGSFLGELGNNNNQHLIDQLEFHQVLLNEFIKTFHIDNLDLLSSLRLFLSSFRLPGEAQQIDRILVSYANHCYDYCLESNQQKMFENVDIIYLLLFSIIMLNTDKHNPNIRQEKKMTLDQFIRNNLNYGSDIKQTVPLPRQLLEYIYMCISNDPLKTEGVDIDSNFQYENLLDILRYNRINNIDIYINIDCNNQYIDKYNKLLYNQEDKSNLWRIMNPIDQIQLFHQSITLTDKMILSNHINNLFVSCIYPIISVNNNQSNNQIYIHILDNFNLLIEKLKLVDIALDYIFVYNYKLLLGNDVINSDDINSQLSLNLTNGLINEYTNRPINILTKINTSISNKTLFILLLECLTNISNLTSPSSYQLIWFILCLFHQLTILPYDMIDDNEVDILPQAIRQEFDDLSINQSHSILKTKYNANYKGLRNNVKIDESFHDYTINYLLNSYNDNEIITATRNLITLTDLPDLSLNTRLYNESILITLFDSLCQFIEDYLSNDQFIKIIQTIDLSSISWLENVLFEIVVRNRERIHIIWDRIKLHIYRVLHPKANLTYVVERAVVGVMRLSTRLLSRDVYRDEIIELLGNLFRSSQQLQRSNISHKSLSNDTLTLLSPHISSGIWIVITSNIDALLSFNLSQWKMLFDIMSNCASNGSYSSIRIFELLAWMIHEPRLIAEVPVFCVYVIQPLLTNDDVPVTVAVASAQLLYILHSRLEILSSPAIEEALVSDTNDNENFELWENCWIPILKTLMCGVLNSKHEVRVACSSVVCKCICDKLIKSVPIGILINSLTDILMPTIVSYISLLQTINSTSNNNDNDTINDELVLIKLLEALCSTVTTNISRLVNYPSFDKLWLGLLNLFSCFDSNINKFEDKTSQSDILNYLSYILDIASKEGIFIGRNALWQVTINTMSNMKNILHEMDIIPNDQINQ